MHLQTTKMAEFNTPSARIHALLGSLSQHSTQYSFQATVCFLTSPCGLNNANISVVKIMLINKIEMKSELIGIGTARDQTSISIFSNTVCYPLRCQGPV